MKYTFKPSPNYRTTQTTSGIMADLTGCLCAILVFSAVYYGVAFGAVYGIRVIGMAAVSVLTALASEAVYFKVTGSKDIKTDILHSYGWVTALILTLITRLDVSYYAVIVATAICIIFGKLVFGGFGQNIFNPAAMGEAIIMNYFAASKAAQVTADVFTGATPVTELSSYGWIMEQSVLGNFVNSVGGYGNLLLGGYPSVIGGSCALLIVLCGAFMLWRRDIDWHLSVFYLLFVFCLSLIVGLIHGAGISYAFVNLLTGGVLFCAVFMMTDPVTTPITIPGRMIFAAGAAALTLMIRWKANLPDGALFSLLLMNMVTPAIDKMVKGNQIKEAKKIRMQVIVISACCLLTALAVGAFLKPKEVTAEETKTETVEAPAGALGEMDFSVNNASCEDKGNGVYACKADGYAAQNEGGSPNEAEITVADGKVVSVTVTAFNDTAGIGDSGVSEEALAAYAGADLNTDVTTGATASFTDGSVKAMVAEALKMAGK